MPIEAREHLEHFPDGSPLAIGKVALRAFPVGSTVEW